MRNVARWNTLPEIPGTDERYYVALSFMGIHLIHTWMLGHFRLRTLAQTGTEERQVNGLLLFASTSAGDFSLRRRRSFRPVPGSDRNWATCSADWHCAARDFLLRQTSVQQTRFILYASTRVDAFADMELVGFGMRFPRRAISFELLNSRTGCFPQPHTYATPDSCGTPGSLLKRHVLMEQRRLHPYRIR